MTQSPYSTGLKKHDNVKHKGLVPAFKCEFCPHVATERGNLRQHIRSKHEHVKETCSQCDLSFSSPQNLRKHKQSVHEGIRYSCDQFDFKTAAKALKMAVRRLRCDRPCGATAAVRRAGLGDHLRLKLQQKYSK